jgi:hypothetical protein
MEKLLFIIHHSRFWVSGLGLRLYGLGLRLSLEGLGSGIRGLGSGVWDFRLGFSVWAVRFEV